ncbi:PspC domain-containing protein [Acidiphilium sp. AL]|uniref:PspC domain-containing protein n=1 Tax=Acidiphilium iwatense TaxID=768198 RepID=A0ABS9DR28_9PROT|nr:MULTISPECIES: PspC domain-containing protein [Acidiphilium]MCF3945114.1 PspC domain-containing protein [Acidiphilium iwatense]MCU4160541.1 PspC domain-containing protein [Acidiphilium sp. AL]
MSTTMSQYDFSTSTPPRRGMAAGVCASLAAMVGVPVWIIRAVAVLLLLWHPIVIVLAYLACAAFIRHGRTPFAQRLSALRDRVAPPRRPDFGDHPPPVPPIDGLASRFATLDLRLAELEARAADPDRLLRRRFDSL